MLFAEARTRISRPEEQMTLDQSVVAGDPSKAAFSLENPSAPRITVQKPWVGQWILQRLRRFVKVGNPVLCSRCSGFRSLPGDGVSCPLIFSAPPGVCWDILYVFSKNEFVMLFWQCYVHQELGRGVNPPETFLSSCKSYFYRLCSDVISSYREPGSLSRYSYGLDGRVSIARRGKNFFPQMSRPALGPT
jgi:hypothetical protein